NRCQANHKSKAEQSASDNSWTTPAPAGSVRCQASRRSSRQPEPLGNCSAVENGPTEKMVRKRGENRGRKTDHARRRQIVDFRAQGWTFARIGAYFGVSRQCVQTLYRLS